MNPAVATRGWRERLLEAMEKGVVVFDPEWFELKELAGTWESCAIGENREDLKDKGYPFAERYMPSYELSDGEINPADYLGMQFHRAVKGAYWIDALNILNEIEDLPTLENHNE